MRQRAIETRLEVQVQAFKCSHVVLLQQRGSSLPSVTPTCPPWQSDLEPRVAGTREAALAAHQTTLHDGATIDVYTDGSLTEQGVGAAAVSTLGCKAARIGFPAIHTVFVAELRGIEMELAQIHGSMGLVIQRPGYTCTGTIFTDN